MMRDRQVRLRGITRLHQPSPAEPLIVILIDELAALSYVNERDLRRRIDNALGLLLSQGRAVGITVIGAIQDPRKEVLPARDLFPVRIALRLAEADQVRLILGPGTRDRGARCDQIPHSLPGVGFVQVDGIAEPVQVRFAFVTDDHIRMLARRVATTPLRAWCGRRPGACQGCGMKGRHRRPRGDAAWLACG